MFDAIVVGARCAGSPLAMLLARRGHRVLVVDRATFPSDTISTHYVQQTGLLRLRDWGLLDRLIATNVTPIHELTFSFTDIKAEGFADPVDGLNVVYCPRRTVLDKLLVDAAREAGAEVREGFSVRELIVEDGRVVGIRGQSGGQTFEERAPIVVGADGNASTVAKLVDAEIYRSVPASCFVYYTYFSGLDWHGHHRTGFGEQQCAGWPTNDGLTLVTMMQKRHRFEEFRADVDRNFRATFHEIDADLADDLETNGKREERYVAMRYPDNYYRRSSGPGWALIGDAGYHKDPFTGQGITDAFKQAEWLADRIHAGLAGERPMDEAVAEYVEVRDEQTKGSFEFTVTVSELTLPPELDTIFRATARSPRYVSKLFGLIAGSVPGEEFFAPENIAELYAEVGKPEPREVGV